MSLFYVITCLFPIADLIPSSIAFPWLNGTRGHCNWQNILRLLLTGTSYVRNISGEATWVTSGVGVHAPVILNLYLDWKQLGDNLEPIFCWFVKVFYHYFRMCWRQGGKPSVNKGYMYSTVTKADIEKININIFKAKEIFTLIKKNSNSHSPISYFCNHK